MNNDNDLNFHSMTKLSDWLRYWSKRDIFRVLQHFAKDVMQLIINFKMPFLAAMKDSVAVQGKSK